MWTAPAPEKLDGPLTGPDRPILEAYLNWQRTTLLNICTGLTGEQLAMRPIPVSSLSLLGLVRHRAEVERIWFRQRSAGEDVELLYDPALGKRADFDNIDPAEAEKDFDRLRREWRLADQAVAEMTFDDTFALAGETYSLRMVYVHMIGEYSRHNGHADLLREAIDGTTAR